jgi:hypothetical protein
VETHDRDPREEHDEDPWREAGARWASIGDRLRDQYRSIAGDDGPSELEIRDAVATLGEAARRVTDALGTAMKDPEVREQVRDAAASLVSALGATFGELGEELRRPTSSQDDESAPDTEG